MDDTGPAGTAVGERSAPGHQRVDQGVIPVARRRVDDQPGRLVDHGEMLVLEYHDQGDGMGGNNPRRLVVDERHFNRFGPAEESGGASHQAVDGDGAGRHESGGLGSGQTELIGKKTIETLGGGGRDGEGDRDQGVLLRETTV